MKCKYCGAEFDGGSYCPVCGSNNEAYVKKEPIRENPKQAEKVEEPFIEPTPKDTRPSKSKIAAGLLAILVGGIGVHEFYLGRVGLRILCILFCWTGTPALIAFIQGIIMLVEDSKTFEDSYKVRNSDKE